MFGKCNVAPASRLYVDSVSMSGCDSSFGMDSGADVKRVNDCVWYRGHYRVEVGSIQCVFKRDKLNVEPTRATLGIFVFWVVSLN
jgi:hypothetical protein